MIDLCKVGLTYDKQMVLSDVNCMFKKGDFACVIGKNGCGKSTLLRALAGLMPYYGSILLGGNEIRTIPKSDRVKIVSYLPQTRSVPSMDVWTLISHGRYPHLGFSKTLSQRDKEIIKDASEIAGVEDILYRNISTLSGGERQKAYIAMTVAQNAEIMLLDEPTAYLDIEHQLEIMELLLKLHKSGKGIIMVVHDLPQAFNFASHIFLIAGGTLKAYGSPSEIYQNEMIKEIFGVMLKRATNTDDLYSYRMVK